MVILKRHALLLEQILTDMSNGKSFTEVSEGEEMVKELEAMGLIRYETPIRITLTYAGSELANTLRDLYQGKDQEADDEQANITLLEKSRLAPPQEWTEDWRFLGSEIIAMLDAAHKAGRVGPIAQEALMERGLAQRVRNDETKKEYVALSNAGKKILNLYREITPRIEVDDKLAGFVRDVPLGPAHSSLLPTGSHEEHLLEAMRLIAYSVPNSDVYAFTALGQAIKMALQDGGFAEGTVISEDIFIALAEHLDGEGTPAGLSLLQTLNYVGNNGELLPSGEWLLEAYRLWKDGPREDVWSFALEAEEVEIMEAIDHIWEKTKSNPEDVPTFDRIRREMIDRKIRQYKDLLERYGRKLEEMPEKYQLIARRFQEAKDLAAWYDDNFDLRQGLYALEAFSLIREEEHDNKAVYRLTDWGRRVLQEQTQNQRDISSVAVKAITMTRKTFSSPNVEWWQEAKESGLIGTSEPSDSGWFYAKLAEQPIRMPYLSEYEMEVFQTIPPRGITIDELYSELTHLPKERIRWALEKLEARHLIDILPDGNIVETLAGEHMDAALSGRPQGLGEPVNPTIIRVLQALYHVGTLYVKEKKVRMLPRNLDHAIKASGLARKSFEDALELARAAGFVGQNSINESGLMLLEAVDMMNPSTELAGFTEISGIPSEAVA